MSDLYNRDSPSVPRRSPITMNGRPRLSSLGSGRGLWDLEQADLCGPLNIPRPMLAKLRANDRGRSFRAVLRVPEVVEAVLPVCVVTEECGTLAPWSGADSRGE